ncbi:MAG TPA: hypothetical protein VGL37_09115 [Solirubrobacteraceae bacterium]|jgi:hypothetical protein
MRLKVGVLAVVLVGAVALSAIAVGSASADEWFVEGAKLAAGKSAALATTTAVDEFAKMRVSPGSASEVEIECTGAALVEVNVYISSGTGGMAQSLTLEKCSVTKPTTGCALEGQPTTIKTNALGVTTALAGPNTKVGINVHPLTKKTFTEIPFTESSTCLGGGGLKPVNGSILLLSSDGATEAVTHTLMGQGSVENNSLESGGNKTIFEGGLALLKLASGSKWSFHA